MVSHHLPDPGKTRASPPFYPLTDQEGDGDSGIEDELKFEGADSTIFLAFKGDVGDSDFQKKLETILQNVPRLISMESNQLKVQKVEPWNSVRVTFNIPREAAERLRLLAQGNNQQLRDLGILSVQIEGEGAINLALPQNRGPEVRMNGPVGANNSIRVDAGFAAQGGGGVIRMNSPATAMMSQGPHVSSAMMTASGSSELQPRTPRPPSQQDTAEPMVSSLTVQQQSHPSGSLTPQIHPMQTVTANRPINQVNFQQFQQQARLPQHQQVSQGLRQNFAAPSQVPVPPGWNQLASGALQPPPAQGGMGTSNQVWKKSPMGAGQMQQQQFPQRPSLATVQTPSHPPPPYPFGSQQASQAHSNFPSVANQNQFSAPPMKTLQGGPSRVPTPLQQSHLSSKSPASSPSSSFQQSSPASSPSVNQAQQQAMGQRTGQGTSMPQGFQQQSVSSPSRGGMITQGNAAGSFMMQQAQQQSQGPQVIHAGVTKRLPPGFQAGQANANFLQGQTPPSASGSPANGGTLQQQGTPSGQGAGGQANGSSHSQIQGSHGGANLMQTNLMGLHSSMNNQQAGGSGVGQINMNSLPGQTQQGQQSQLLGMHQQILSSQSQMVNLQGQAPLNTQGQQLVLSRTQLLPQGQILGASPSQNLGSAAQRMTPPKQMIPSHNQMMVSQGQAMMQQNPSIEQIMQGGKQVFSGQNPASVLAGQSQIIRGPTPSLPNNMMQFSGQTVSQQGAVNGNTQQGGNMQGQVLRPSGPVQHLQQTHVEAAAQSASDLGSILPDISMQQAASMASQHIQNLQGNSGPGQHFAGHGLPFNSPFGQGGNGSQLTCGQNSAFPINKDVTLTSPLLVNLLQSDISAGHFGVNNKQGNSNAAKPKKKKPPRKKKNQQGDEPLGSTEPRMEDPDQMGMAGEQVGTLDVGQKLSDFTNRPPGYPSQQVEQRQLQQIPSQLMQLGQQQGQGGQTQQQTPPPQMMMMLMMQQQQQQQQQDQKAVRLPLPQGIFHPRAALNSDPQRMPMQQGSNLPVMVSLQGSGSITPSPDKQRMSTAANASLGSNGRKMGFPDSAQNQSGSPLGDGSSATSLPDASDLAAASGPQSSMAPHLLLSQNQLMMAGTKSGAPLSLSLAQGASPQQQHSNTMPGPHGHHFQSVQTPSQTSRPKTPNRASPRPYYPQTPNNRPPSTEPSEISLSPERLNASIAGLFPPQINIPLPPRPTLNRGFDQQGLNPTTLKAIGQVPPGLTMNNQTGFVPSHMNKMDSGAGKQTNTGGNKRASPSNSRRSSPASSRKTTPSPGRQNSKANKLVLGPQQAPGILQNMEMQRNLFTGQIPMQTLVPGPGSGPYPSMSLPGTCGTAEEIKDIPVVMQESDSQTVHVVPKEQTVVDHKPVVHQELKITSLEESARKESQLMDIGKPPTAEENKTVISPAMRDAPTSLSQLLDHSSAPNLTIKSSGPIMESPPMQLLSEDPKISDVPTQPVEELNKEVSSAPNPLPDTETGTGQARTDTVEPNSNVSLNLPASTLKRPAGPTSISNSLPPNQITVFVTSNPITSSASAPTPMTSHLQPTLMSTVMNMPNVGNKVIVSEGQQAVQSSTRPQFITPVFFNSSSIIQVMKGSQQGNMPASTMAPNTNLMPQSVAVVGPLHISQNIQFSPGPPVSTTSSSNVSSMPTTRPVLVNPVQTTTQHAQSPAPSPVPPPSTAPPQFRDSSLDVNSQLGTEPDECAPAPSQPTASPLCDNIPSPSSNSPSSNSKRSSAAASKAQSKVDKIGQLLLTKACKKVTDGDEQLPMNREDSDATGTEASRTPPLPSQTTADSNNIATMSSDPVCPVGSTPADILPSPVLPTIPEDSNNQGCMAEKTDTPLQESPAQQTLETVSSQSTRQEEGLISDKESIAEKGEADPLDNMESEPAERSRPPSRRNSKVEESLAPQEVLESGQRKRSARPGSASGTAKESGASPPQPKRRKSK
ncbi:nuclear receptor coactivator 6 [Rhinophrynus dorsalis]